MISIFIKLPTLKMRFLGHNGFIFGTFVYLFISHGASNYNCLYIPNFYLSIIAISGLALVPIYFFKCYNAIVIEPECYKSTRTEPLRNYELDYDPKIPLWSPDIIQEFWEVCSEVLLTRKWSDQNKTEGEIEMVE
jgi:hypothetical protein